MVIALLARQRSVAWPRLTDTEVVPAILAVVLVAVAAGVAVVVVVGQAGMDLEDVVGSLAHALVEVFWRDLAEASLKHYTPGEYGKHWKIVTDASVRGRNHHDLCLELVSPILQGSEGLDQLRVLMEHVRLHGGVEELREAEAWVRLVLRFCSRTPTADITPIQTLVEEATPAGIDGALENGRLSGVGAVLCVRP